MNNTKHIIGAIARELLGLTFVFSGLVKAIDPLGTVYKIEDYLRAFEGFFLDLIPLSGVAAACLIVLEFLLGVCLICNVRTQWTAWLSLLFMCVMTPLTLYIALTNPVSDCGCFGDAIVLSNWATFWKNIVLLTLVVILLCCRRAIPSTFVWWMELLIAGMGLAFVLGLMAWTIYHLPLVDFRPYKVGNNIPELMAIPDDAEQDVYEVRFIYERNGKRQEFTLEDYPKGDPEWTFVDQKSKLIKKGFEPIIHGFEIITMDYEDITYDVLESETPVTLVIMYDLPLADASQIDKVRDLLQSDMPCYLMTGSAEQTIIDFCDQYDLPIDQCCICDPVTLKTIVRANPGVIVVQNGIIIDKYNVHNR